MSHPMRPFETARTRRFREGDLDERDERTISNLETYGCEVVQVEPVNRSATGWSYTI